MVGLAIAVVIYPIQKSKEEVRREERIEAVALARGELAGQPDRLDPEKAQAPNHRP